MILNIYTISDTYTISANSTVHVLRIHSLHKVLAHGGKEEEHIPMTYYISQCCRLHLLSSIHL